MILDRSLILDIGLGISVAVVYHMNGPSTHTPNQLLWYAVVTGLGTSLFARFFIRRFFLPHTSLTPEEMKKQLDGLDAYLQKHPRLENSQQFTLLEQAGTLALALEQWSDVVKYYAKLAALFKQEKSENPEQKKELERHWFHTQLTISFALFQNNQKERSLQTLEQLQSERVTQEEPIFALLIELFQARIISQDDAERGQSMLNDALLKAQQEDYEEDALRLVASEWIELGQPEEAVILLQRAMEMAQKREDAIAETEVLYQLGYAYGAAKQLPQAAQALVQLTKNYILHNYPTPQQIEQLRAVLREQFGKQPFRDACRNAEKKEQ